MCVCKVFVKLPPSPAHRPGQMGPQTPKNVCLKCFCFPPSPPTLISDFPSRFLVLIFLKQKCFGAHINTFSMSGVLVWRYKIFAGVKYQQSHPLLQIWQIKACYYFCCPHLWISRSWSKSIFISSSSILSNSGDLMCRNNFTFWAGLHRMSFLLHTIRWQETRHWLFCLVQHNLWE